jgi:prephenate dehydrogenase
MEIAIIGFGAFGQLMAKHLSQKTKVFVTDKMDKRKEAGEAGAVFVSLKEALTKGIIVLAVPMQEMGQLLKEIKESVNPRALVLDVCSLKMFSCNLMENILPETVEIIGTHPLFGPQSAKNGINGKKIALVPVRTTKLEKIKDFCELFGLKAIVTTAEEHDKQMAIAQVLPHFIARALKIMQLENPNMDTKTSDSLFEIVDLVGNDSPILFENIQKMNPFAKDIRDNFLSELKNVAEELN